MDTSVTPEPKVAPELPEGPRHRHKRAVAIFTVILLAAQLVPVKRDNPAERGVPAMPISVRTILKRSCYDCHSNETSWPFYSYVAPISWVVAHHVHKGREHLNLSEWETLRPEQQRNALEDVAMVLEDHVMPLPSYLLLHPKARLGQSERALLSDWIQTATTMEKRDKTTNRAD